METRPNTDKPKSLLQSFSVTSSTSDDVFKKSEENLLAAKNSTVHRSPSYTSPEDAFSDPNSVRPSVEKSPRPSKLSIRKISYIIKNNYVMLICELFLRNDKKVRALASIANPWTIVQSVQGRVNQVQIQLIVSEMLPIPVCLRLSRKISALKTKKVRKLDGNLNLSKILVHSQIKRIERKRLQIQKHLLNR